MLFPNKHIENTDNILTFLPYIPLNFFQVQRSYLQYHFQSKILQATHWKRGAPIWSTPVNICVSVICLIKQKIHLNALFIAKSITTSGIPPTTINSLKCIKSGCLFFFQIQSCYSLSIQGMRLINNQNKYRNSKHKVCRRLSGSCCDHRCSGKKNSRFADIMLYK